MESALTKAYTIKLQNFEGPFDLLFHLIEKNQLNIYDIPINDITDQYIEYLFAMQKLDLEIASEFLVMAATLLHIKSKMLLPDKKEKHEDEPDPRDELVLKLIEYKKYREYAQILKEKEKEWGKVFYKLPEIFEFEWDEETLELSTSELKRVYEGLVERNKKKADNKAGQIEQIIEHERISLKSNMVEIIRILLAKSFFKFSEFFSLKKKSKTEVVTGFLAILELSKLKKAKLVQKKLFNEIMVYRYGEDMAELADDRIAVDN